ncbi:4-aminobutyrate aminotransferase [Drechslerella dactyloides]|uniref:4-aminobutyrate aminotransferase n=1 Tax=Drechslerella dactyloides TaxID=74499 RepID=A0AAD6NP00_DREDA|nr:4-aminobutyrate aminotransferase [Drechslerella dactyloides]
MFSTLRGSSRAFSRVSVRRTVEIQQRRAIHNTLRCPAAANIAVDSVSSQEPFFPNEPTRPKVKTEIPGPRSQVAIRELDEVFDTRSLNMICDYSKSVGNYISDNDQNLLLDVYAQIASIPLGYCNPALIKTASSQEMVSALVNRPALGNFPPASWEQTLKAGILRVAPNGLNQVFTGMSGSDANECAYKAAFMFHRRRERGEGAPFTEEELNTAMNNQKPGSPDLAIMSFRKGFHGRLFGSLSTTRSKPIHKIDIPSFNWPQARFPQLKYPLEEFAAENEKEERECLAEVEEIIKTWHCPVSAVVIEPIQSEGGDFHASPTFFQGLRDITLKNNVLLIVDEVQTGVGATGKFWAHMHWNLTTPPDIVTFSKKAQTAGYYFGNPLLRPNMPYRQFNTWMGDPARVLLFNTIIDEVERLNLVEHTADTGAYLYSGLEQLSQKYPGEIQNLRGKNTGTFIAWDSPQRDAFLKKMKTVGVNIGGCGESAVRLRPMLVFQRHHADILLESIEKVLKAAYIRYPGDASGMSFFRRPTDESSEDESDDALSVYSDSDDDDVSNDASASAHLNVSADTLADEAEESSEDAPDLFHPPSINAIANNIRKSDRLSISNRLHSIHADSQFVQSVADALDLPLVANERCGSWYVPSDRKAGSCYFKSTDGHFGCWSFSLRRLNLGLLELIGRRGGCIIVDSTRRGKSLPDALSKTVPIWCAVLNAVLFPEQRSVAVEVPGNAVSDSEKTQISALLDGYVRQLREMKLDVTRLASELGRPMKPVWVTRDTDVEEVEYTGEDFHPVYLLSASRYLREELQPRGASDYGHGFVYIQGAGDDHEGWARGLLPAMYWSHRELLLQTPEAELPDVIDGIVKMHASARDINGGSQTCGALSILSKADGKLAICDLETYDALTDIAGAVLCVDDNSSNSPDVPPTAPPVYRTAISPSKAGSKLLRTKLPEIAAFAEKILASHSPHPLVIACQSGNDVSVGIALALSCRLFDDQGRLDLTRPRNGNLRIDKLLVRQRLGWILSDRTHANPSRATLQAVNLFLMGWDAQAV